MQRKVGVFLSPLYDPIWSETYLVKKKGTNIKSGGEGPACFL